MLVHRVEDIEQQDVVMEGVRGVKIRWLLSKEMGTPHFAMREFTVEAGGHTPFHAHGWEHEVYILSGQGKAVSDAGEKNITAGSVILVQPGENHNFKNSGNEPLKFLCMIPNQGR